MNQTAARRKEDLRSEFEEISTLFRTGKLRPANHRIERVLADYPDNVNFLHLGGIIKQNLGELELAEKLLRTAQALRPNEPEILHNLAVFLLATGQPQEAALFYEMLTNVAPKVAHIWANYGHALRQSGKLAASLPAFEKAQELDPQNHDMTAVIAMTRRQMVDWDGPALPPNKVTANLAPIFIDDPAVHLACVTAAASIIKPALALPARSPEKRERIRVGYLSNDLHEHATSYLMAGLFGAHDRAAFEIFVYSTGPSSASDVRARMQKGAEHWVDMQGKPPAAVAEHIRADGIDILVDLKGYTRGGMPEVLAARPAPVTISWLGYPGSMGASFIDYIIADSEIIPEGTEAHYSEKIIRMPNSYQVNDSARPLLAAKTRSEYGLPEKAQVLCSFNQSYKITPAVFDVWMRVLKAKENTVLWLFAPHEEAKANLQREAVKRGVDAARIIFADKLPQAEHIARYRQADLVLDTHPYGGHTTTSDAIWAGTPVVAFAGRSFAARVSASLLMAAGLKRLIATDIIQYEALILNLIDDEARRMEIKSFLQKSRDTLPLFNTRSFAKNLEDAYRTAWAKALAGEKPEHMRVGG